MSNQEDKNREGAYKVEWLGIDGALCLIFALVAIGIGYCLIHNVDIVIGTIVPWGVTLVTGAIFVKYLSEVLFFARGTKGDKKQ